MLARFPPWAACFGVLLFLGNADCAFADPNALWNIVNGQCVPHAIAGQAGLPCSAVSLSGGYAVLKHLKGKYQYLLTPTRRVTGIEDPYLETAAAPNYFADAWTGRKWLETRLGETVPRQDVALAVNSFYGRTQNQLHIHIDCLRPDVAAALAAHAGHFGAGWTALSLPPFHHVYLVRQIEAAGLSGVNPFALVAAQQPKQNMALKTVIVAGAPQGFYLLSGSADLSQHDFGSGEELQDQTCAIVQK
jgi:CDP-diacylglycerol pyrophosphatase